MGKRLFDVDRFSILWTRCTLSSDPKDAIKEIQDFIDSEMRRYAVESLQKVRFVPMDYSPIIKQDTYYTEGFLDACKKQASKIDALIGQINQREEDGE